MPRTHFAARPDTSEVFADVRRDLAVPGAFAPEVEAAAASDEGAGRVGPEDPRDGWVTIDPEGSRDLDQAFLIERSSGGGWHLSYAIADVAAHVRAGGPVDLSAHERGVTLYLPDGKAPLHPTVLSEGRASLLPGQPTPALVWEIDIDSAGLTTFAGLARRTVTSAAQLAYDTAAGAGSPQVALLEEAGRALVAAAEARGALDLPEPSQEVVRTTDGEWALVLRSPTKLEQWNAQMSLAVGRAAGGLQADAGWGLLRTLPVADLADVEAVRLSAVALGHGWSAGTPWAEALRTLDPSDPRSLSVLAVAARLLRGASYHVLADGLPVEDAPVHAAVAGVYAHATAPLRRLADRFVGECCLSAVAAVDPPQWVVEGLGGLADVMLAANRKGGEVDRACIDTVEALLLQPRVGQTFAAVAVDDRTVQVTDPAVRARCDGDLRPGESLEVRLTTADVATRTVRFAVA